MKKVLYILPFLLLLMGCGKGMENKRIKTEYTAKELREMAAQKELVKKEANDVSFTDLYPSELTNIDEFWFRNHHYIFFSIVSSDEFHGVGGLVHDPDCPCYK